MRDFPINPSYPSRLLKINEKTRHMIPVTNPSPERTYRWGNQFAPTPYAAELTAFRSTRALNVSACTAQRKQPDEPKRRT